MIRIISTFIIFLFLVVSAAKPQEGFLDPTFSETGTGLNGSVLAIAIQPDGKILAGGYFTDYNGTTRTNIARFNTNGTLDGSFNCTGTGLNNSVNAIAVQSDGKILIGGRFTDYNGTTRNYIARLESDGSLDVAFNCTGSGLSNAVNCIIIQSNGKILIGGNFMTYNLTSRIAVARLESDGSLDASFVQEGTGFTGGVRAMALQSNGSLVVGGNFTSYNGNIRRYIARLNSNGTLDPTFTQTGSGLESDVRTISLQTDGKVIVGGSFINYDGINRNFFARLNSDGSLDNSFSSPGGGFDNFVLSSTIVPGSGKIIVGGLFNNFDLYSCNCLARINSDGTFDDTFTLDGSGFNSTVNALALQSDYNLLSGGYFTTYNGSQRNYLARIYNYMVLNHIPTLPEIGLIIFSILLIITASLYILKINKNA